MERIRRTVVLTEEEKEILVKAKNILEEITDEIDDENIFYYNDGKYIENIVRVCDKFEY